MELILALANELVSTNNRDTQVAQLESGQWWVGWILPPFNIYKLNMSDATFATNGVIGVGGVLCDHEGNVLFSFYEFLWSAYDAMKIECLAL